MKKKYVISATVFDSKQKAEEQIQEWIWKETYNDDSVIYEIDENTPQYVASIKLKKIK